MDKLNHDDDVDGFIVQLPLPKHIDRAEGYDGYRLPQGCGMASITVEMWEEWLLVCLALSGLPPLGILTLLQHYQIETSGKKCVILGRSNIGGQTNGSVDDAEAIW